MEGKRRGFIQASGSQPQQPLRVSWRPVTYADAQRHPRPRKRAALGWSLASVFFHSSPGDSNVQPTMESRALGPLLPNVWRQQEHHLGTRWKNDLRRPSGPPESPGLPESESTSKSSSQLIRVHITLGSFRRNALGRSLDYGWQFQASPPSTLVNCSPTSPTFGEPWAVIPAIPGVRRCLSVHSDFFTMA